MGFKNSTISEDISCLKSDEASSLLPKLKEIWEIDPEKHHPIELEEVPDLALLDGDRIEHTLSSGTSGTTLNAP